MRSSSKYAGERERERERGAREGERDRSEEERERERERERISGRILHSSISRSSLSFTLSCNSRAGVRKTLHLASEKPGVCERE
jgi:hypothetical protein